MTDRKFCDECNIDITKAFCFGVEVQVKTYSAAHQEIGRDYDDKYEQDLCVNCFPKFKDRVRKSNDH